MEDSFLAEIQSTMYFKLCSLDIDSQFYGELEIELHKQPVSHISCQGRIVELEFMFLHYQR